MNILEFELLSEDEKAICVINGNFLSDRMDEKGKFVQLFAVGDFYVERYYDATANMITHFTPFKSMERLTPYLAQIRFNPRHKN